MVVVSRVDEGKPGNDFHDRFTGRFTFAPGGTNVLGGNNLLKRLSAAERTRLFQYAKIAKPNQLLARQISEDKIKVIFLRDGKRLADFDLTIEPEKGQKKSPENVLQKEFASSGELRDFTIDMARNLEIQGRENIENHIKRQFAGVELSPGDLLSIENQIKVARMNDLLDYLHYKLRVATGKAPRDEIRLAVGRGYRKRLFRSLSKQDAEELLVRLQARGWQESQIQEHVVDTMPKRLKSVINVPHKEENIKRNLPKDRS